jgi:hypothetical protein
MSKEILLTDMSKFLPSEALSRKAHPGYWQLVNYETSTLPMSVIPSACSKVGSELITYQPKKISGNMIFARAETGAPEITLPLSAQGWYAIHLGFMGETWAGSPILKIKLTDDPCFTNLGTEADIHHLEEGFWKVADLTGRNLVIAQSPSAPVSLAYVRLVPLAEEEVRNYQGRSKTKRLIAMSDGGGFGYRFKMTLSTQSILEEIEPYRDTDFGKIFIEMWHGDHAHYPAKVGVLWGQDIEDFPQSVYRLMAEGQQEMKKRGIDVLAIALEHAHQIGLEFYASIRLGFGMCPPGEVFEGPFFREHPELRCRDYDGTEISHPSFAFPEVRNYVLSLLRDTARYDIDGVNLIFQRGYPFILYEKPLVDGFRDKTGIDSTTLAEKDARWKWYERILPVMMHSWYGPYKEVEKDSPLRCTRLEEMSEPVQDWLRYRAQALTEFMRELRELLQKKGKGQKISAAVCANEMDNFYYGTDVETWIKEGLVDILIIYPWPEDSIIDFDYYHRIRKNGQCEIYPILLPRQMIPKENLKKSIHYYQNGADGLAFWGTNAGALNQWQVDRELGHKEELKKWLETEHFPRRFPLLRRMSNYTIERHGPETMG